MLASLAPAAEGPLAAALDGLLDALLAGAGAGGAGHSRAARSIVAALVAAGAQGAELWALESPVAGGWRRLAGAGCAVPDAERHINGRHQGYQGTVAVVRAGALSLAFSGALPDSDERDRREDLAETLMALARLLGSDGTDTQGGLGEAGGPLRAA